MLALTPLIYTSPSLVLISPVSGSVYSTTSYFTSYTPALARVPTEATLKSEELVVPSKSAEKSSATLRISSSMALSRASSSMRSRPASGSLSSATVPMPICAQLVNRSLMTSSLLARPTKPSALSAVRFLSRVVMS